MDEPYQNIQIFTNALVGAKVQIQISEPWEFGAEVKTDSILAIIEQISIRITAKTNAFSERESILIRVLAPFAYKKLKFEFLLASPRHDGKGLHQLQRGEDIPFNFLRIPELEAKSDDPFRASKNWRGGPECLIGMLRMK
jgi:hypothetical protein